MPPNGLSIATATARSVGVRPFGTNTPPTFSAPAVAVDPDDEVALCRLDAAVEGVRDPTLRVVEDRHGDPVLLAGRPEPCNRVVRRAAVRHEQLDLALEVLCGQVGDDVGDVLGLVEHRRDHGHGADPPALVRSPPVGEWFRAHSSGGGFVQR
jgi:hypothetical protein